MIGKSVTAESLTGYGDNDELATFPSPSRLLYFSKLSSSRNHHQDGFAARSVVILKP